MRWRRDDRQQPDDTPDLPAEEWLSQFRPVRPEALTSADRDATGQPGPARGRRDRPDASAQPVDATRDPRRDRPDGGRRRDDGRYGNDEGHWRTDDSWARTGARPAADSPDQAGRYPDRAVHVPEPDRRDATSLEATRRAAPGWESGSGKFAPGWDTGSGQLAAGRDTGSRQSAPGRERRPDSDHRGNGHGAGPLDDTAGQRPAADGYGPAAYGQRPGGADSHGHDGSGERSSRIPGPEPRQAGDGDRRANDSYLAGPDSRYQARDGRGDGSGFASDVDPRRLAREGRAGVPDSARDGRRPSNADRAGSPVGRDPWRPSHERNGERDDYGQDRRRPAAGTGELGRGARGSAGNPELAWDVHAQAPGDDGFRSERPGFDPGARGNLRDARGLAAEPDGQRPEPDRFPAARGGFRTDWDVLRAVRDGLRAEADASRPEGADRFARDGFRPDVPRDASYGRHAPDRGPGTPERDSWQLHPAVPREPAYKEPDPQGPGRGRWADTGAGSDSRPAASYAQSTPSSLDDDTLTWPLPVILPGATALPRPAHVEAPRGPFEPARPSQPQPRPASITGSVEPPAETFATSAPPHAGPPARPIPKAAAAKLDQIKDLYLTAEAIGEDALDRHFDQVSQRQRELIREFFERSGPGTEGRSQA